MPIDSVKNKRHYPTIHRILLAFQKTHFFDEEVCIVLNAFLLQKNHVQCTVLEMWPSGRRRSPAKGVCVQKRIVGSNPTISATHFCCTTQTPTTTTLGLTHVGTPRPISIMGSRARRMRPTKHEKIDRSCRKRSALTQHRQRTPSTSFPRRRAPRSSIHR